MSEVVHSKNGLGDHFNEENRLQVGLDGNEPNVVYELSYS